ncbi:short-chain dehydrogenase [Hyaloscypha hepaticicola]|uniref:Short-chain dehydrogenase n=1 Tax=Hyaloscypha hepaticicola TaxID=2082293 RepID=A0A2J6QJF9_9HELO|nr:short-chain dehydrogenase [Hyaloscypha hepaticicola]
MLSIFSFISQMYPPEPGFKEKDIPSLKEKVYIITGSNTGIGLELAKILFSKRAKIYIAARSKSKALSAINDIKSAYPSSTGCLEFLPLDLADLSTIKASAQEFLSKEKRLDALFNNAGVMNPPQGSKTAQGYELQLGTNCVGTFISVRVVWVSSSAAEGLSPKGGVDMQNLDYKVEKLGMTKYGTSKAGNYLHATEFAKRYREEGIVSVLLNPENLDSELYRNQGGVVRWVLRRLVLYPPIYGAYTLLFAGLSEEVTVEKSGDWVVPWGRFMSIRGDLVLASKSVTEGGTGIARAFWEWSEEQIRSYL